MLYTDHVSVRIVFNMDAKEAVYSERNHSAIKMCVNKVKFFKYKYFQFQCNSFIKYVMSNERFGMAKDNYRIPV